MKTLKTPLLLLLLLAFVSINGQNTAFYVSPSGDDTNSGLTIESPLKTINDAIALMHAGDTLYLLNGVYKQKINLRWGKNR